MFSFAACFISLVFLAEFLPSHEVAIEAESANSFESGRVLLILWFTVCVVYGCLLLLWVCLVLLG